MRVLQNNNLSSIKSRVITKRCLMNELYKIIIPTHILRFSLSNSLWLKSVLSEYNLYVRHNKTTRPYEINTQHTLGV